MVSNFSEIKIARGRYVDNELFEKITVIAKSSEPIIERVKKIVQMLKSRNINVRVEARMSRLGTGSRYYITYIDFVLDN
jgi:biotin synthase-related radical SAM superfamily protein